jgi:hypothetical protein
VTGDGLADIVHYDPASGNVSLWINLDGQHFGCAATGCVIGRTFDDVHGTFNVGPHSILAADMNGDGIDAVVILAQAGIFVIAATQKSFYDGRSVFAQHAPRPGLLTHIDNGSGATTRIHYRTIQDLDVEAEENGQPWDHHSRAVESVVTDIETRDTTPTGCTTCSGLGEPYGIARETSYSYRDPAYDPERVNDFETAQC